MLKKYALVERWLKEHNIQNYKINRKTLTVDVGGFVYLDNCELEEIPIQFGIVKGSFTCSNNKLRSLKGSPEKVFLNFDCSNNQLSTLEFLPKTQQSLQLIGNPIENLSFLRTSNQVYHKLSFDISSEFNLESLRLLENITFDEVYLYFEGVMPEEFKNISFMHDKGYFYLINQANKKELISQIISKEQMKKLQNSLHPKLSCRKKQL